METETPTPPPAIAAPPAKPKRKATARQLALCNPAMLAWGRTSIGLTVEEAAAKLMLKVADLISWELGEKRPTIPQLRRLAQLYRRSMPVFYLTEPPTDWQVPRDWRRLPGEPPRRLTPELIVAVRMAYYRRSIVLELDPDASQSPLVGSTEPATRATDLAARARDILGVTLEAQYGWDAEHDSLNGWMAALEERGILVFHFTGVAVKEVRGFSLSERVLPVVGINGHDTVNGRIFTLAHELGHLMLGEGGSCDLGDATLPSVSRSETEIYANRFAGALLVPAAALLSDPVVSRAGPGTKWEISEIERLAARFRVSREVILRRLVTLERADADFYRRKRAELLALPPRDTEPSSGGPAFALMVVRNVGKPFARLVLDAYHANSITGPDVSDYLGAGLQHLPAIEARLSSVQALTGGDL